MHVLRRSLGPTVVAIALLSSQTGCIKWFKGTVASGIARLTIRNIGVITTATSDDTRCGFESPQVLQTAEITGEVGEQGSVTWRVNDCRIDMPDWTVVSRDCHNIVTSARGAFTVTAEKTIVGRITGNKDNPVVPNAHNSARIDIITATFERLRVKDSSSEERLSQESGSISATVRPRISAAASNGVCSIVTPHTTFENVIYSNAVVHLKTPDRSFEAEVQTSNFGAQNGVGEENENFIKGTLTVWGKKKNVPTDGDDDGNDLNPDYDAKEFAESYACLEDLQLPDQPTCESTEALGHGAARLSVLTLGGVAALANTDPTCGFESADVVANVAVTGTLGDPGGEAVFSITNCVINMPEVTVIETDCNGVNKTAVGRLVVSGTKTLRGYVSGDPLEPIVPTSRDPAELNLTASLTGFAIQLESSDQFLYVKSGVIAGTLFPRTAIDLETGVCSKQTLVTEFENIEWSNGSVQLNTEGMAIGLNIETSSLNAVNGNKDGVENYLTGSIAVDGLDITLPSDDTILDPDYDPVLFDQTWNCDANMEVPTTEEECNFERTLAQGSARLLVKSFGLAGKAFDENGDCGFAGIEGILPSDATIPLFGPATIVWESLDCVLGDVGNSFLIEEDCLGAEIKLLGRAQLSGTKTVVGPIALSDPPIEPQDRRSVRLDITNVLLQEFAITEQRLEKSEPEPYLVMHTGSLRGVTLPVTGEMANNRGVYAVTTPLAEFQNIEVDETHATLNAMGKQFNFVINSASLNGFNGSYQGDTNRIGGTITLNGTTWTLPIETNGTSLDPEYDQARLDETYACTENLYETVPLFENL